MLVPYRNCGKDVGETAEICLNCGTKTPSRQKKLRENILIGNIIVTGTLLIIYNEWFKESSPLSIGFKILVVVVVFINLAIIFWILFKAITDLFK